MKILHYINNLGAGGAEKLLTDILPCMIDNGAEVHLAISNQKNNVDKFYNALSKSNVVIKDFSSSLYNPFQVIKLINLIRKEKYDIVHSHLFPSQYWLAIASFFISSKTKLVKTEHSVFNERKNYKVLRLLEQLVYSRYRIIIAITDAVKDNLAGWLRTDKKIIVIKNGVNLNQIIAEREIVNLTKIDFIKKDHYNLLMVGRFDHTQKDQLSLIKSLDYLTKDYNLIFIGDGPTLSEKQEYTRANGLDGRVQFLGIRSDVYQIMNSVDLNILSTNHEGLSGVALESLASGKPFIGTDVVGVQEIVPDSRFLFPPQQPKLLAEKITEIRNNPKLAHDMVEISKEHVKKYDTSFMVKQYLDVYKNIIG